MQGALFLIPTKYLNYLYQFWILNGDVSLSRAAMDRVQKGVDSSGRKPQMKLSEGNQFLVEINQHGLRHQHWLFNADTR